MKFAVVCLLVALAVAEISAQSNNIEWGTQGTADRLVFRQTVRKEYSFLQIVTQDIEYKGGAKITFIKCTDLYTDGDGGYATLNNGGLGESEVTINLESQRGHGFNFYVEIYATDN